MTLNGFIRVTLKTQLTTIIKRPHAPSSHAPLLLDYAAFNKPHGDGHTLNAFAPLISRLAVDHLYGGTCFRAISVDVITVPSGPVDTVICT